ncbi:hypothetical protein GGR57DRAFT_203866 [Xylariaceae sp. FL1272]|nr:hypothetical protein GGR57DRAFT_203866 [Xylariaceae sp. FL1272]
MPDLPILTSEPRRYPGCCLSLSTSLLDTIATQLAATTSTHIDETSPLILSIGSGTGLVEELLQAHLTQTQITDAESRPWRCEGVELSSVNTHLPEDRINTVRGTWALHPRADDATVLLFVYPREIDLVAQYLEKYMKNSVPVENGDRCAGDAGGKENKPQLVIWIGPRIDYLSDYTGHFVSNSDFEVDVQNDAGIDEYESFVVLRRRDK